MEDSKASLVNLIIDNIGGLNNISKLEQCATSIRIKLINEQLLNKEKLKESKDIITVTNDKDFVQIVLGGNVSEIYELLNYDYQKLEKKPEKKEPVLIKFLSGIFGPILMILSAAGLVKGLLALCIFFGWISESSGTYTILYTIADGFFYFMPIFLGFTAAKQFGCEPFLGMAIGAALCYPSIVGLSNAGAIATLFDNTIIESNVYTNFFGLPIILPDGGYTSTVLPVIFAVAIATPILKGLNKIIPAVVRAFLAPALTLLITIPLTFLVIGPVAAILSALIGQFAAFLYDLSPFLEGAFIGGFWQVLVIFGLHWALVPIMLLNLSRLGYDAFMQPFAAASFGQTAVVLAIYFRTKDKELKEVCIPAVISGIFGITEPALYGVTLPRIKYFVIGCIASALGGAVIGMMRVKAYIFGGMGLLSLAGYISPKGDASSVTWAFVGMMLAALVGFVVTFVSYKDNKGLDELEFKDINK